jgi:hypothetical protein
MAHRDDGDGDDGSNDDEQMPVIMGRAGWFCFVLCLRCSLIIYQIALSFTCMTPLHYRSQYKRSWTSMTRSTTLCA